MKINSIPINFSYNSQQPALQRPSLSLNAPLACDSVSFGAHIKKTLEKEIESYGEENIPKPVFKKAKDAIAQGKSEGVSLFNIHQEYYNALENAQTIEEAKKLYPEFSDIKQVTEIAFNKSRNTTCNQIKLGKIPGLTPENTSLLLLKHVYCGTPLEGVENLSQGAYQQLKATLVIPGVEKKYATYLLSCRRHMNPEFRRQASERMKAQRQDADFNAKSSEAARQNLAKLNQNPAYVKKRAERTSEMHKDPVYAANRDQYLKEGRDKLNSTPELRAKQIEASRRKSLELTDVHSEALSRAMKQVWDARPVELQGAQSDLAKEFPRLGPILTKRMTHQPLDESEFGYLKLFYKAVYERYPELKEHLSNNLGKAYKTAYKTVKGEYEKAQSEGTLDQLLKLWKKAKK